MLLPAGVVAHALDDELRRARLDVVGVGHLVVGPLGEARARDGLGQGLAGVDGVALVDPEVQALDRGGRHRDRHRDVPHGLVVARVGGREGGMEPVVAHGADRRGGVLLPGEAAGQRDVGERLAVGRRQARGGLEGRVGLQDAEGERLCLSSIAAYSFYLNCRRANVHVVEIFDFVVNSLFEAGVNLFGYWLSRINLVILIYCYEIIR